MLLTVGSMRPLISFVMKVGVLVAIVLVILILLSSKCQVGMMNMPHSFDLVLYQKTDSFGVVSITNNRNIDLLSLSLNDMELQGLRKPQIDIVMIQIQISISTYPISLGLSVVELK